MRPGETEVLYLTTTGRRTGRPREIEIWFTQRDARHYLIAEHLWETHWVQNVLADPRVSIRVGDEAFPARARVIERRLGYAATARGHVDAAELQPA